ncbi:aminotransferase class I/II-fold pyridoxal phosphate-dependent enzyme [Treponema sp. HNW]|uniref:pyridoxal phosphate-dependent aminotransferase n=1 Tax=Treponema sp. HNW TaxID=3116654 RepID=UPI003D0F34BC
MLSQRIAHLHPYVPGEQPSDKDYIKLNANENPYPPSQKVLQALKDFIDTSPMQMSLYPDPESRALKRSIARMLNESGGLLNAKKKLPLEITEDMIFCGNGSDEVLSFIFYAFFDSDKPVLLPEHTYSFYPVYGEYYNIPLKKIPLRPDWTVDTEALVSAFKNPVYGPDVSGPDFSGFICANPNAPTGIAMSLSDIESILQNAQGRAVVIDEAYADFSHTTALPLLKKYENLIIVRTFSKSLSFAGMRLGYCIARSDAAAALTRVKNSFNHFPVDALTRCAAEAVCADWRTYAENAERIVRTRDAFSDELRREGWTVLPSSTNFIMVKKGGLDKKPALSGKTVYEKLKNCGFLVRYFAGADTGDFVRITIGTAAQMKILADTIKKL